MEVVYTPVCVATITYRQCSRCSFEIHPGLIENSRGGKGNEREDVSPVKVERQPDKDEARKAVQAAKLTAKQRFVHISAYKMISIPFIFASR
jgi:hypothetical protein